MDKSDWLLLSIGKSIEPIQIQKTLFKFAMESGAPGQELYAFIPYNWGACSFEIYDSLKELRENSLLEFTPSGYGWNLYRLTKAGEKKVNELKKLVNTHLLEKLNDAREYVVSRDFEKLLSDIYSEYPQFSTASLFNK